MSTLPLSTQGLAADPTALNALRYGSASGQGNDKAAVKEAAKQFEALFMRELIKSMREATQKSGLLDGESADLGTDLLDQQLAVQLSGQPGGLSEAIERQLMRNMKSEGAPGTPGAPGAEAKAVEAAPLLPGLRGMGNATVAMGRPATPSAENPFAAVDDSHLSPPGNDTTAFKPLDRSGLNAYLKHAPLATPFTPPAAAAASPAGQAAISAPTGPGRAVTGAAVPASPGMEGLHQRTQPVQGQAVQAGQAKAVSPTTAAAATQRPAAVAPSVRQANFVSQHSRAAAEVARESGIPASFMIGQAGHETGWGRSEIRRADGSSAHNLFGIKATKQWKGKVAEVVTTEYIGGVPRKTVAKFRAYDSYAEGFRDYARLITKSPRYDKVMDNVHSVQGFANSLQRAGYATDPLYAAKLGRAINTTQNLQRATSVAQQRTAG